MLDIKITGNKSLKLKYLVLDYNGTLAVDGMLISGVMERLIDLAGIFEIYVVTADTFGSVTESLKDIKCNIKILKEESQDIQKADFIKKLGANLCVAIGNGLNDNLMMKEAELGISVIQKEGAASKTIFNSDIVTTNIIDAMDLLKNPKRIIATLRK